VEMEETMEKRIAELRSRVAELEQDVARSQAEAETLAEKRDATALESSSLAQETAALRKALEEAEVARGRAEEQARRESDRATEMQRLYVEAAEAVDRARVDSSQLSIPAEIWEAGPTVVDLYSRLLTENMRLRPLPPAEAGINQQLHILATTEDLDTVLSAWEAAGDDRSASLSACRAIERVSFDPAHRHTRALAPCVRALDQSPQIAAAAMSALWNLSFDEAVLAGISVDVVDKVLGHVRDTTVPELRLSAVAVLTNLALRQDLRIRIPPASVVEACKDADGELLEQGLICLYLLASREMREKVIESGASRLAEAARGHKDSSVENWGLKLEKLLQ